MRFGPWSHEGFPSILALVEERAGLAPPSCPASAEEGISRAMARAGVTDFDAYRMHIDSDPAAMDDLLTELTIGETYFFRTPEHFEYLRRVILPALREQQGDGYNARLWSAGCSSGEEAYSMAALLMNEGWGNHMTVFATDVSRTALSRARRAHYGEWSLRGPWAERMRAYLRPEGRQYVLSPEVKQHVRFSYLNLALDTWPSPDSGIWRLDVVFCRNVLIYFNNFTIEGVARRLHASLREGGILFTGPSDPPLGGLAPLEPVLTEWGVLYRRLPHGTTVSVPDVLSLGEPMGPRPPPVAPALAPAVAPVSARAPAVAPPAPPPRAPEPKPLEAPEASARRPSPVELGAARAALERGDWHEAATRMGALDTNPETAATAVRAIANLDTQAAIYASAEAASRHPLVPDLRYLEALLLLGQGRLPDAERSVRQALYLEPTLAVAWLVLGRVLNRLGDTLGALKALREAEVLCDALPADALLPLAEGERASDLGRAARDERVRLELTLIEGKAP
ncbi:CheR family methyltransferase [Myxococcus landrumensis]|uniref:Chemotaxis protein CheR n=1 Tax=Myxococcus landrumensis TaxID=2813577 RepID=A0ABX7N217_9BACT|nr:protein-glutamate O-methyltransferase CheR [Myxococcus landrumus]QSQ12474.1 chemotaxis protein CheR [Myxococcus landrumus]